MTCLALYVPQSNRISLGLIIEPGHAGNPFRDFALRVADRTQAAKIALDISRKHGYASIAELFGQALKGDGFACPRGACHQAMAIGQAQRLGDGLTGKVGTENKSRSVRHFSTIH